MNSTAKDIQEFTAMMNRLDVAYRQLPNIMATTAVNFSKERFRQQSWIDTSTQPWRKRKSDRKKDAGRAILVKTGKLRRDIHKIFVNQNQALIGTSKLTGAYARAHNEGYHGSVTVKAHSRKRYTKVKEKYKTKTGNERTRSRKTIDNSQAATMVKSHKRKMNLVQRRFLGPSKLMDTQIKRQATAVLIRAIKG